MKIYRSESDDAIIAWQWRDPSLRNITNLIMRNVPYSNGSALDVGCGTGRVSFALAERGFRVRGIDIEERAVKLAREIAKRKRMEKIEFEVGDFVRHDLVRSDRYDLVVCSEVLEHVAEYERLIENMYAALKPGGRIIVTVPAGPHQWSVLDEYSGHLRRFTVDQMKLGLNRFSKVKFMITGFPFSRLVTSAYLAKTSLFREEHASDILWSKKGTRRIAAILYPLFLLDNLLAFTRLGDTLVAVGVKPP